MATTREHYRKWLTSVVGELNHYAIRYAEVAELYSFMSAYRDGMSPVDTVADCLGWLELDLSEQR